MASLTNEVVDGVVSAIVAAFPEIPVYDEQVSQGLPEPAFTVRSIHPRQALFLNNRYQRNEMIEVVYFPPVEGRKKNTNEVIETLFSILEIIQAGNDLIRGTDMDANIDDDGHIGVFTVNYKYFVKPSEQPETLMNDLTVEVEAK